MQEENKIVWTIGHSTRPFKEFVAMLEFFQIHLIADIRHYPGSRRFPQYNKEILSVFLRDKNMEYIHLKDLGGRRKANANSKNTAWRNAAFRGYADYMETDAFKKGIQELESIAIKQRTAFMCSEAVWWRCHRSLVSDYLKANGWKVMHIMDIGKEVEHPYTVAARITNGQLTY